MPKTFQLAEAERLNAKLLAALDGLMDWALSNRGTAFEFVTCRSNGNLLSPALVEARIAIEEAKGD
jgi:hypothetical protein